MRHGLSYFNQTIFDLLPIFYRRVDTALANIGQPHLPLEHNLFSFGRWGWSTGPGAAAPAGHPHSSWAPASQRWQQGPPCPRPGLGTAQVALRWRTRCPVC
jgi:hypothetical protein